MSNTLRINNHLKLQHKLHKAGGTAILTGRHLQSITAVFRAVEFVLFLVVISRFSHMLPATLAPPENYFRDVGATLVSPRFVFVVGNAIVVILFLKSGGKLSRSTHTSENHAAAAPPPETTFIVSVYPTSSKPAAKTTFSGNPPAPAVDAKANCYRRSKSEKMQVRTSSGGGGEKVLRRTKTEAMERHVRGTCKGGQYYPEDRMSSEEFRRTIEDFIAKQQRFLREEEEEEEIVGVSL